MSAPLPSLSQPVFKCGCGRCTIEPLKDTSPCPLGFHHNFVLTPCQHDQGYNEQGHCVLCGALVAIKLNLPKKEEAQRNPIKVRYDILDPEFLKALAMIAHYGAEKYGDFNWHKSRLEGDKSPVNHIYKHLASYRMEEPYDHKELGQARKWHLAAIAFNAMMEFYYESREGDADDYRAVQSL